MAIDREAERRRLLADVERDLAACAGASGVGKLSAVVSQALLCVPRHEFVPAHLRPVAWENRALPIDLDQTISQPTIVALMTELLQLKPDNHVLEVGTGSGYQAAVLAAALPRGRVHTVEIHPELAERARLRLQRLGYPNVDVTIGDGREGLPDRAPFAGILVTAVGPAVPDALLAQLAPGARLVMPVGRPGGEQWLVVASQDSDGARVHRRVLPVRFVPLTGGD